MQTSHAPDEIDPTLRAMLGPSVDKLVADGAGVLPCTHRIAIQEAGASGWIRAATIRPGFSIAVTDVSNREQLDLDLVSGDHLKLHCRLEGSSLISDADEASVVEAGRLSFLVQPKGEVKHEAVRAGSHARAVTLVCSRDFLGELVPRGAALPSELRGFLKGPAGRFCHRDAVLPRTMRHTAEEMLQLETGRLADLMLEAKALELLYLSLRELSASAAPKPVSPRTHHKVQELCELLDSSDGLTMSIAQLCRALAWNETQMMGSFKQVMGVTISTYRQQLRMDLALVSLRTSNRSIGEIAFDAGYEHPSNFATAFKRSFGFSPKLARAAN